MSDLTRISKRHPQIPQDALPLDIPATPPQGGDDSVKSHAVKSIKWARCPHHVPNPKRGLTGLIAIDNKTLAFRDHTKTVGNQTIPCPGSGLIWEGEISTYVQ